MRAIGVPSFGAPSRLSLLDVPEPVIAGPEDIVVAVHAVGLNPGDPIRAAGWSWLLESVKFVLSSLVLPFAILPPICLSRSYGYLASPTPCHDISNILSSIFQFINAFPPFFPPPLPLPLVLISLRSDLAFRKSRYG
jgi:hypothetical protein